MRNSKISLSLVKVLVLSLILFGLGVEGNAVASKNMLFDLPVAYADHKQVNYPYTMDTMIITDIDEDTVKKACDSMVDNQTVIMYSGGGTIHSGFSLGECFQQHNVKLIVDKALSIAPFVAMYANNVCLTFDAEIGTHQPYYELKQKITRKEVLEIYQYIYTHMVASGLDRAAASVMINAMDRAPPIAMADIHPTVYAGALADSFEGICVIAEIGKPWTL